MSRLDEIRERLQSREAFRVRGAQTWTAEADADITWLLSEVERLQFKGIEDCRVLHGYLNDRDIEIARRDGVLEEIGAALFHKDMDELDRLVAAQRAWHNGAEESP